MKPKITLIQPNSAFLLNPLAYPSLGLLYISDYLKRNGYEPYFYDLTGGLEIPKNIESDIFAFSCQLTQFPEVNKIKEDLKENNPNAKFVIGGNQATWWYDKCLTNGFDSVVRGEGEASILRLIKDYEFKNKIKKIYNPEKILESSEINSPDWDAINLQRYNGKLKGKKAINMMGIRGNCPYNSKHCHFCSPSNIDKGGQIRFRNLDGILEEAEKLKEKGYEAINLYDDEVMINKKRDLKMFEGFKNRGLNFRCMLRANAVDKQELKKIRDYGCLEICIGVESADPRILKTINKGINIEDNSRFVNLCHEINLPVKAYLIAGLPGESRESLENTKKWLLKNKPDGYDLSTFIPYPGSYIYENKDKFDINWNEAELEELLYYGEPQYGKALCSTSYLSREEINELKNNILEEFPRTNSG